MTHSGIEGTMTIGLIDVDGHNFPNLALMKISAHHKAQGNHVEWWNGLKHYDRVYMARVFTDEYTQDESHCVNADEVIRGGTGYGLENKLPTRIENQCPDYTLYPRYDEAYGFLTRGCPRNCPFCIVTQKEGAKSVQVADLDNFWQGQKEIKLLDPNLLACKERERLLLQLAKCSAWVDFTQGLDARLLTKDTVRLINAVKIKNIHFAWDNPDDKVTPIMLQRFADLSPLDYRRKTVYILTNYNTAHEQDLERVYKVWEMGYSPYVMIYDKAHAPQKTRYLQRWANNPKVFKSQPDFKQFNPALG